MTESNVIIKNQFRLDGKADWNLSLNVFFEL